MVTRADRAIQFLYFNPFFDYEHLEKFLRLQPGDQVIVKITKGDKNDPCRKHFRYTFDTKDGSVRKDNSR